MRNFSPTLLFSRLNIYLHLFFCAINCFTAFPRDAAATDAHQCLHNAELQDSSNLYLKFTTHIYLNYHKFLRVCCVGLTILKRILGNFRGYSIQTWDCLDVDACTTLLGAPRQCIRDCCPRITQSKMEHWRWNGPPFSALFVFSLAILVGAVATSTIKAGKISSKISINLQLKNYNQLCLPCLCFQGRWRMGPASEERGNYEMVSKDKFVTE